MDCVFENYFIFGLAASLLLHRLSSSYSNGGVWAAHRCGFSCCGARALGCVCFGSRGPWAQ